MKKIFLTISSIFLLLSCESYLDVNEDQSNNADASNLTPNKMLAGAINNYVTHQQITMNGFGNEMSYVWALNVGYTSTSPRLSYDFTSSDESGLFESAFLYADNFQDIIDKKATAPQFSYHYAIAKLFKVITMDNVVSLYGDVPYSEAFNSNIAQPKYDDDETIIPKLFAELDEARDLINNPDANVVDLGAEDIVFGGDTDLWLEYSNTIELRMLVRLSKTTKPSLIALRTSRFATLDQTFISDNVSSNPGYGDATIAQRNPVARVFGRNVADDNFLGGYLQNAAASFASKLLQGQINTSTITSTGVSDPRRARHFSATNYTDQGVFPSAAVARVASFYTGRVFTGSLGKQVAAERNSYLMQLAESYFLQAEAVQRGYMSGSAETLFDQGIAASFTFLNDYSFAGVGPQPALALAAYKTAISSKNGLGWAGSADKINCIITQKYLALMNWNGMELYLDHLRTGFPALPLPVGNTKTGRPFRLVYPSSEYSVNSSNVPNVTNADLFVINSKTPVYLQ